MPRPVRLKYLLGNTLKSLGLERGIKEANVQLIWREVVGEKIADVTEILGVKGGIVRIATRDSMWSQELSMIKPEIIRKLNDRLGEKIVRDIRFSHA